ncbi:retrovirus-related pol polyprotein from transposon TNT 1-94, partial [Tanacetum coccineum]
MEHIPLEVVAQEPVVTKVYTRRPMVPKTIGSNSKPKIAKTMISNKTEPGTSRRSNTSVAPSSSSPVNLRISGNQPLYIVNWGYDGVFSNLSLVQSLKDLVARNPQQNGVVERRNCTLVEAARTMLIYAKAPLFLWSEAVATACYTQNRSIIRLRHGKTPYELLHDRKPNLSYLHVFGALCYPNNDSETLGKLQAKANIGPGLQLMTPASSSSGLVTNLIPQKPCNPPNRDDWDRLFQSMFDKYFNPPTIAVSPVPVAAKPRAVDIANSLVSTSIDLDAPSISITSTQEQEHSSIISQ